MLKMILAAFILAATPCFAEDVTAHGWFHVDSTPSDQHPTVVTKWNEAGQYLEVTTKSKTFRIYPSGRVEAMEWKELNPSDERPQLRWGSINGGVLPLGVITYQR